MTNKTNNVTCRGKCLKYKVKNRYNDPENGYCALNCGIFIRWEGTHCPCCGYKLRRRPRTNSYDSTVKYRKKKGFVYQ